MAHAMPVGPAPITSTSKSSFSAEIFTFLPNIDERPKTGEHEGDKGREGLRQSQLARTGFASLLPFLCVHRDLRIYHELRIIELRKIRSFLGLQRLARLDCSAG